MWLRLLVPFALIWPVLALAAEGTALRRYRGTPTRELLALVTAAAAFFALWIGLDRALEGLTGSTATGLVASTVLSLLAVPVLLFLAFRVFGVRPAEPTGGH